MSEIPDAMSDFLRRSKDYRDGYCAVGDDHCICGRRGMIEVAACKRSLTDDRMDSIMRELNATVAAIRKGQG